MNLLFDRGASCTHLKYKVGDYVTSKRFGPCRVDVLDCEDHDLPYHIICANGTDGHWVPARDLDDCMRLSDEADKLFEALL